MNTKYEKTNFGYPIYIMVILTLIFLAATGKATWRAAAQEPNPHIEAFAWYDRYSLVDWPAGKEIQVTITNPDYMADPFTPDGSQGWYDIYPGIDLRPGSVIMATNGETTKELIISPLDATVDPGTGIVTGIATPESTFHMKTDGDHFQLPIEQDITAGLDGSWLADFSDLAPLIWFTRGEMWEGDDDGDITYAIWHVRNEVVEVWLAQNEIRAFDWPVNTELTFTVEDPETGDIFTYSAWTEPVDWMESTWAVVYTGDLQLVPGMKVTVSDGKIKESTKIQDIKITGIDFDQDVVYGTAPNKAHLELGSWEDSPFSRFFDADKKGNWMVNYNDPSVNGVTVDLNPGDELRLFLREPDKDATVWQSFVPNTRVTVFPDWDYIEGYEWPFDAAVHLAVDDPGTLASPDYEQDENVVPMPWDPNTTWVTFNIGPYDLKPRDIVTLSGQFTTRSLTVQNLSVTSADPNEDTVGGQADPGAEIFVWPHATGEQLSDIADSSGNWQVDFTDWHDLVAGEGGRAEIRDQAGNATAVDWTAPKPWLIAFPENDAVEGWEWPEGAEVTLTINDVSNPAWSGIAQVTTWGDTRTYVRIEFGNDYDLKFGDQVTLTSGAISRTHIVQNLAVTTADAAGDIVAGSADPGATLQVWPHGYDQIATIQTTAAEDGSWVAAFSGLFDLVVGTGGRSQIVDEAGNITAVDWNVPVTIFVTSTEDIQTNDGICTLREAIIAANTNSPSGEMEGECPAGMDSETDTIVLSADQTYSLTIDSTHEDGAVDGDLDIWDNSASTDLILMVEGNGKATISQDAAVDDRVMENHGATVHIEGLTLTGGSNVEIGGGVHITGGTLIMNVSTVSGNMANDGGGIYNDISGTLILAGSTVSGNTANMNGGGLENGGTLTVDASTFSANSATYGGGGLFTYMGTVTIQNGSVFGGDPNAGQGNTANYGGGIAVWSGSLDLVNSTISGNSVTWVGGAIRNVVEGTVTVHNSTISNNYAGWDGGGILNEGTMIVGASEVRDNTAALQGGGIGNFEGNLTITASTVSGNTSGDGGGVVNWPNSTLVVDASTFTGNFAGGGGGLRNQGTATITNGSQFTDNNAGWIGGAITNDSGSMLQLEGASIISGNSSGGFAGGLYNDPTSLLTVNNSTIASNVSVYGGGGIINEGTLTVDNSILSANSSGQGGALYNPGTAAITNTTVGGSGEGEGNIGTDGGGGLFNLGTMTVDSSIVSGNWAPYGGGLFNWIDGMLTINGSSISGNSADQGGGLTTHENSTTVIQNGSLIVSNTANGAGGGVNNLGTLTITDSSLRDNTSLIGVGNAINSDVNLENAMSIAGSCIVGNGGTAVFNSQLALQIATGNWWGDPSGPSGVRPGSGDSVGANVDFSGWLVEPPTFCTSD